MFCLNSICVDGNYFPKTEIHYNKTFNQRSHFCNKCDKIEKSRRCSHMSAIIVRTVDKKSRHT